MSDLLLVLFGVLATSLAIGPLIYAAIRDARAKKKSQKK